MPKKPPLIESETKLTKSINRLNTTIEELPQRYGYAFNPSKNLVHSFFRGIAGGLGTIVALAIIIPIIVGFLRMIDWVPLVGNFAGQVIMQIDQIRGTPGR